jgi:hypothetical protein
MVARSRPFVRTTARQPALIGTDTASSQLQVPGRTLRRWVKERDLGTMIGGRRVLTPADVAMLEQLRDGVIC